MTSRLRYNEMGDHPHCDSRVPPKVELPLFTVERGEHMRIRDKYDNWMDPLYEQIKKLERQRDQELYELSQQCKPHEDDGGMFHGFCTRCGECLG